MKKIQSYKHILIGFLMAAAIMLLLKPVNGLTPAGVRTLASFVMIAYWWITVNVTWTSVLSLAFFALSGAETLTKLMAGSFGHYIFVFSMLTMLLCGVLQEEGVFQRFIAWFLSRPGLRGKPFKFIIVYSFAVYLMSCFVDIMPCLVILTPIATGVIDELGYTKDHKFSKAVIFSTFWGILLGYGATPIAHNVPLVLIGMINGFAGTDVTFIDYMKLGVPSTLLLMAAELVLFWIFFKPEKEQFQAYDPAAHKMEEKLSFRGKVSTTVFLVYVAAVLLPSLLKDIAPAFYTTMNAWGITMPAMLAVGVLCIIRGEDDKPLLNFDKDVLTSVKWSTLFLSAGMLAATAALSNDTTTGIVTWLTNLATPIVSNTTSWVPFVLFVCVWAIVQTNFMSCMLTANMVCTVSMPLAVMLGGVVNPVAVGCMIAVFSNVGIMTPAASSASAWFIGQGYIDGKEAMKYGVVYAVISVILGTFVGYPIATMLF